MGEQEERPGVENREVMHERTDIRVGGIVLFAVSLVVAAMAIHLVIWVLFGYFSRADAGMYPQQYPLAPTGMLRLPPAPRLQEKPREDLKAFRAAEEQTLREYGWADLANGIARIPIDEAMKRVLERGLPAREGAPPEMPGRPTVASSGRVVEPVRQSP